MNATTGFSAPTHQLPRAGGATLRPIYPQSIDDVRWMATRAITARLVKPAERDDGSEESPEEMQARVEMQILQGAEVGLPPTQCISLMAIIGGRITIHSEGVPGLLLSKGFKIKQEFTGKEFDDNFTAVCTLTRPDGQSIVSKFSVADARRAGLWTLDLPKGALKPRKRGRPGKADQIDPADDTPWTTYPRRMLWARALGFAAKDLASDAMRGMMLREEAEDMLRAKTYDLPSSDYSEAAPSGVPATTSPKMKTKPRTDHFDDIPEVFAPLGEPAKKAAKKPITGIDDEIPLFDRPGPEAETVSATEPDKKADTGTVSGGGIDTLIEAITTKLVDAKTMRDRMAIWDAHSDEIERLDGADRSRVDAVFEGAS
jgi:hypothetical protein